MSAIELHTKSSFQYRFGSAIFDESRFELTIAGLVVDVERKPLEVLSMLLSHAGEVVTKEELLSVVWEGRPTVEHVVANALTKLRNALGEDNSACVVTVPRVGYRFEGSVKRLAVGRVMESGLELEKGNAVPFRAGFQLDKLLNSTSISEVWLAHHVKTKEQRVFKFAPNSESLSALKREVTLHRVLRDTLGRRTDLIGIYDWNFEAQPFFIECEYGGQNLTEWAGDNRLESLSVHQRMELFLQIADVVAAAHDVGVLHKDIKPANVLVESSEDGSLRIRLTDFGSGSLLDPQSVQALGITQLGVTLAAASDSNEKTGTLLYMAPEVLNHQPPTIKSDIYALGIMLFQLIVGDLRRPMAPGWERDIEDELLRSDIHAATEGDPQHRLSSVHELISRLRTLDVRYQQLQQDRQSQVAAVQARETLRRAQIRRPWMIAAGIAGVLFLLGFVTSLGLYVRAVHVQHQLMQAQEQTRQEATRANAVTTFLNNDVLGAADALAGQGVKQRTVKEAVTNAANTIDGKFADDPMTEVAIRMTLGHILISMMDDKAAEIQWRRAVSLLDNADAKTNSQRLQSHYFLAHALSMESKFDQAAKELASADYLRSQAGTSDHQTMFAAHNSWGVYYAQQHQDALATPHFEQALKLLLEQQPRDSAKINYQRLALANSYISISKLKEAGQLSRQVLDDLEQQQHPNELTLLLANRLYGETLLYQHNYQAAELVLDRSYHMAVDTQGINNRITISILDARCALYSATQRREEDLQCARQAYDARRTNLGDQHVVTLTALLNVGESQYALNRYVEATRTLEAAHKGLTRILGAENDATQGADYYLARCLLHLRQTGRAEALTQSLNAKTLERGEPGAPWTLRLQLLRGLILLNQGRHSEALSLLLPANQLRDDADPTDTILQEARQSLRKIQSANNGEHLANMLK